MENRLSVYNGSIYDSNTRIIEELAFILDKTGGMMRWGEKENVERHYTHMMKKYRAIPGLEEFADNLILISFDKYTTTLSNEDICTLGNYIINCSSNGEKILSILNMSKEDMVIYIKKLKEIGY